MTHYCHYSASTPLLSIDQGKVIKPAAINMTVGMSFGGFWFHIDEFFCGECLFLRSVVDYNYTAGRQF